MGSCGERALSFVDTFLIVALAVVVGLVLDVRRRLGRLEEERHRRPLREPGPTHRPSHAAPVAAPAAPPPPVAAPSTSELEIPVFPIEPAIAGSAAPASEPERIPVAAGIQAAAGPAPEQGPARPVFSLEAFLGGQVFLAAGVVAVLFALAFFFKYAIDRGLIGPGARVLCGLAGGMAAIVAGNVFHARGHRVFGHGLMGGGLGALYISIYFASARYGFLGQEAAFGGTALVTAAGSWMSIRHDGPHLAWLGFLGGFLAPAFLDTGQDSLEKLAVWLVLLDVGLLVITWRRNWAGLDLMALTASIVYLGGWYETHYKAARMEAACLVVAARVVSLFALALLPSVLTGRRPLVTGLFTVAVAGVFGVFAAHDMLYPLHRTALAAGIAGLGLLYAGAGWMRATHPDAQEHEGATLYALALASLATLIAVVASDEALPPAWAFTGAAAVFAGARRRRAVLTVGGFVMIGLGTISLFWNLPVHRKAFVPFVNGELLSTASPFLALAAAGLVLVRESAGERAKEFGRWAVVAAAWLAVPLVVYEMVTHFDLARATYEGPTQELTFGWTGIVLSLYCAGLGWFARSERAAWRVLPLGPLAAAFLWGLVSDCFGHDHPFTPVVNVVFVGEAAVACAVLFTAVRAGGVLRRVLAVLGLVAVLGMITGEIFAYGQEQEVGPGEREAAEFRAQVAISVAWALYAAALLVTGFVRRRAEIRWMGLGMFLLTLAKVFLFDMAELDTLYRIGSFLGLGVLLVGASFLYLRLSAATTPSERPAGTAPDDFPDLQDPPPQDR